jgi:hypothetical protein
MASDRNHGNHQIRPVKLAGTKQDANLFQPGLEKSGKEDVTVVPECGDDRACAEPPCAIAASKHNDCHIDQCLKRMKQSNARVKDCRQNEGENEESGANPD